jgi:hypothetical protein
VSRVTCWLVTALAIAGATAQASAAADSSTVTGRLVVDWTFASSPTNTGVVHETGRLVYAVNGPMMGEQARRAYVPLSFPPGYPETKVVGSSYLPARLLEANLTRTFQTPCADGGAADLTTSISEIVDPRSILTHSQTMKLDVLRHRGVVNVMPYFRVLRQGAGIVVNGNVQRGLGVVRKETTGTKCPETRDPLPPTLDVAMLLPRWVPIMWSSPNFSHRLQARVQPDGSVVVKGVPHESQTDHGERTTMHATVDLTFRGALRGMGATCTWPSASDLASATSPAQALAIVGRAGMETPYAGVKAGGNASPHHFWIDTASRQWWCGLPYRPGILYVSP